MKRFVYPKFFSIFEFGFRIGGSGLANCLFVFSRALIFSIENNVEIINPTWRNISIGSYLRNDKDKRTYCNIFTNIGICGFEKYLTLFRGLLNHIGLTKIIPLEIVVISGLENYFESLLPYQNSISKTIIKITKGSDFVLKDTFHKAVAIHIRLGDFDSSRRTHIDWYISMVNKMNDMSSTEIDFLLFSDGKDDELKDILKINRVRRVFYGNAMLDMLAMSRCNAIIASDSTFSAWAGFIGQKPIIFKNKGFGVVLIDQKFDLILDIDTAIPDYFLPDNL